MELKQDGFCSTCGIETGDVYYIFCSKECNEIWYTFFSKERLMGEYDIDKDLYTKWLEEKYKTIAEMSSEEIEARITEIKKIEFFARREWALLHQQYDKITGKKGIAPWLKAERDKLITDPDIQVNWEGEPRKKEKKPKQDMVKNLLGIDMKDMMAELKNKDKTKTAEKKVSMDDLVAQIQAAGSVPAKPKATEEELKSKADALKEKMRLAKEAKEKAS